MSSVPHHPGQLSGFSGDRLNINHFTQPFTSQTQNREICSSFPYPIGPSLPQHFEEPWAALIDAGAVTSIALVSCAPHGQLSERSSQLVNVSGGEIKILGQRVPYITHKVVINITFLIVEDVMNPIIGLDALHQNGVQFHLFESGKAYLQQHGQRAILHYFRNHYYSSGLVIQGLLKGSLLEWEDAEYTIFDSQSTNQIKAKIDFEVNSESRLSVSTEEEDASSREAQPGQCLRAPDSVSATDKEAHSLTHVPFRSWCSVCQRGESQQRYRKGKSQQTQSVIQVDHSSTRFRGSLRTSRTSPLRRQSPQCLEQS